jgi:hypothetical protein
MERALGADSGQKRGPGRSRPIVTNGSRGNDRYPNGRRRQLAAAPVAGVRPRLERGLPKGGAAKDVVPSSCIEHERESCNYLPRSKRERQDANPQPFSGD